MFLIKIQLRGRVGRHVDLIYIYGYIKNINYGRSAICLFKKTHIYLFKTRPKGVDRTRTWVSPLKAQRSNHVG